MNSASRWKALMEWMCIEEEATAKEIKDYIRKLKEGDK